MLISIYIVVWLWAITLNKIDINVEGSDVTIKVGDIFKQSGLKVIAFNEYFDTQVDNRVISAKSLNGIFINDHLDITIPALDSHIESYDFDSGDILEENTERKSGVTAQNPLATTVF